MVEICTSKLKNPMSKILITGGAGCLGSNLTEHLLLQDHEICILDNFEIGNRANLPNSKLIKIVEGSICDSDFVDAAFRNFKPQIVFHCAASYDDPHNWFKDIDVNIKGSVNIAKASEKLTDCSIINFQTALCYGIPNQSPIPVDAPLSPFTSYGISKTAAELYLLETNVSVISLRISNICSPRLSIGPIPTFYNRLKEHKDVYCTDAIRDFLDISDFLSLIDKILSSGIKEGIFNVSSGLGHSIKDVLRAVARHLEKSIDEIREVEIGSDDVKEIVLDPSLTEKTFNWTSKIDFVTTMKKQLDWYDINGAKPTKSHLSRPD